MPLREFYGRAADGNPALTLDDFRAMPKGTVQILHYNDTNKGTFVWIHDRVEGDRVFGQYIYPGDVLDGDIDGYLYECDGVVCRGSGAEPVHLEMPDDPECDDDEEG